MSDDLLCVQELQNICGAELIGITRLSVVSYERASFSHKLHLLVLLRLLDFVVSCRVA